jgi:Zn-dependent protease with chaperone function
MKGARIMDFEETFAKIQRLLTGLAVLALIVALLTLFIWLPWPVALALFIGVCILIPILRQKWIAHRSYTPVYQPPAAQQTPEASPYQRGYQPQQPTRPAAQLSSLLADPQPKDQIYEQPLVQYPETPVQ